ncbi:MAG: UDP-N-acetylglucosamine 1-carboxyvinyltransferase [Clostridia bacterium]|nr:UDP-N-acetylglucosamine 1-carboxyvinyltransferase [Clostridia bacterium]
MAYIIRGGRPLYGTVKIHGAKNSVLPILAAAVLIDGVCEIRNCPQISDVDTALSILTVLGCRAERSGETVTVDASTLRKTEIDDRLMSKMRSSVLFLGALLARCGKCTLSCPGGCVLGERPIDLHLRAVEQLGGNVSFAGERIVCTAPHLQGATICLPIPSVGATENILLMAMGAQAPVTVCNAAKEPEISDLCAFLQACGAEIQGAGSGVVRIRSAPLHGCSFSVQPDRIETATFLSCAACTGGEIELCGCCPAQLEPVTEVFRQAGCTLQSTENTIFFRAERLKAVSPIQTAPYPGFPTDAQAPVMAAMTKAEGLSVFVERIFSARYRHTEALRTMGANICVGKKIAVVNGVKSLRGGRVDATDLRGGAAIVAAALGAEGTSEIHKTEHIARGYAAFCETLRQLGADITDTNEGMIYGGKPGTPATESDRSAVTDKEADGSYISQGEVKHRCTPKTKEKTESSED